MLEQGRKTTEVLFGGKKKKSSREGRIGWSIDFGFDQLLLMMAGSVEQGWKMIAASATVIVKEGSSGVFSEGIGDSSDKGREHWRWKREEGSKDSIDVIARSSITKAALSVINDDDYRLAKEEDGSGKQGKQQLRREQQQRRREWLLASKWGGSKAVARSNGYRWQGAAMVRPTIAIDANSEDGRDSGDGGGQRLRN
ncbi:hypothetical protein B296_00031795 [Ensete ventricosum]|uniref:Uncharacterized protein n=1 Tax=Ensete ventricosum TaxID=4639 RepID=A0A427A4U4_ENSVE|nr:hypothetical protein B296_00031795 [Ensete ventricosum]